MSIIEKIRIKLKTKRKRDFLDYLVIAITFLTFLLIICFQIRSEKPKFIVKGENIDYEYFYAFEYDYYELVKKDSNLNKFYTQYNLPKDDKKNSVLEWVLFPQIFKLKIINKRNAFSITDYTIDRIKFSKEFKEKIFIDNEMQGIYLLGENDGDYQELYNNEPINVDTKKTKVVYILVTFPILLKDKQLIQDLVNIGNEYKNGGEIKRIKAKRYDHGIKFNKDLIENGYCVRDIYIDFCNNLNIQFKLNLVIDNNRDRKSEIIKVIKK